MSTTFDTGDPELDRKCQEWMSWDKNPSTRQEMEQLIADHNVSELRSRLSNRMAFGTAGLRSHMGAGYTMMNDLTIIQTTQGFAAYMEEVCPLLKEKGVVIGYDARHNSSKWAKISASILLQRGIKVYLFSQTCPTPFVAYGVLQLQCDWGIMITASHNPKYDNGYKVYCSSGAQIISPHDKGISTNILKNLEPLESSWDITIVETSDLCQDPYNQIMNSYMNDLSSLNYHRELNTKSSLKFTYTAMHGVGYRAIKQAAQVFGFKPFIPVEEQIEPDPEFPTVVYPNPEEGKSALDLAMKTADQHGSTVILANDPDADRLAIAEKQPGCWYVFKGNEVGALFGWWLCTQLPQHVAIGEDCYTLASTVSSKILRTMSRKEGFQFVETLTGFKWMGNIASQLLEKKKKVIFAFEEAIGFMCGSKVLDKDGVSAAVVAAEMATYLHSQNLTLYQQLQNIYQKYGHHVSRNSYFLCHDPETTKRIFERLRNWDNSGMYPSACGNYAIKDVRDLTVGYDSSQPDKKAILPTSKSSQMITFTFENGCEVTMRTSGTEPKIKYYSEYVVDPDKGLDKESATVELEDMVSCVIEYFFEPEKNKLIPQAQ